ncbi:MAG: lytic transglycosylase domain-containing protein [Magnetococcales bacterium]|nr:lytic transglycosylase domain-containing protein [Magnetococcales bacterium]
MNFRIALITAYCLMVTYNLLPRIAQAEQLQDRAHNLSLVASAGILLGVDPLGAISVAYIESGGVQSLPLGKHREVGIMQVVPAAAQDLGFAHIELRNPEVNALVGVGYLRLMLDRFPHSIRKSIGAYNCGPTCAARFKGVPPQSERYVRNVMHTYRGLKSCHNSYGSIRLCIQRLLTN